MKKHISMIVCCLLVLSIGPTALAQKTAEDFYKLSEKRLKDRDLDGAIAALDKAIELKPDIAGLYGKRSELRVMKGLVDAALADLDKALLLDPELSVAYAARGNLRMLKSDMTGALSDFDNAIVRGERSANVFAMRARLRMMLQNPEGALSDYNAAISMNSGRVGNYLGRAAARSQTGDKAGALADYTYVIDTFEQAERDGKAPDKKARQIRANEMISPVIHGPETTKPGDSKVTTKTTMVATINPEAEETMTAEEMEYLPNVAGAYMNRAQIYTTNSDLDAALADLNKSVAVYPHFGAYQMRGELRRTRGDMNGALADFNKSLELQPGMTFTYIERGVTLMLLGKDDEAEKDFSKVLAENPEYKTMVENRRAEAKQQRTKSP
jgi:tetratricopeptide (TPR) repeat protein